MYVSALVFAKIHVFVADFCVIMCVCLHEYRPSKRTTGIVLCYACKRARDLGLLHGGHGVSVCKIH